MLNERMSCVSPSWVWPTRWMGVVVGVAVVVWGDARDCRHSAPPNLRDGDVQIPRQFLTSTWSTLETKTRPPVF
jgi:hypothetical protein